MAALSDLQYITKLLMGHVIHVSDAKPDIMCPWCAYSAELDHDKKFLKKVPRLTLDMLPSIRRIAVRKEG